MSTKKRILTGTNAIVFVALTVGIAIVANVVVSQLSLRPLDLTENEIYTLSDASVGAVRDLDEKVVVKAFISPDLPPPFHKLPQQVSDLLRDYQTASGGKLEFQIISPSSDDKAAEEMAKGFGIEKVALGQRTEDEVSLRAVYKGVAFVKGEETEVIKDLQVTGNPEIDNFEYEFTKALLNLGNPEPRKVAFLAGFGGPAGNPQFVNSVKPVFEQLYGDLIQVTTVDLSTPDASVPEDVQALVVLNVNQPVSDRAKFAIDQFVQGGGSVGWYQSPTGIDQRIAQQLRQQMGPNAQMPDIRKPINTNLTDLFSAYGVEYRGDLVVDRENALALGLVMTPQGLAQVSHPATFLMTDINRSLPFTRNVSTLSMPAPSSLAIKPFIREEEGVEVYEVVKTDESAARKPDPPMSLSYKELSEPAPGEEAGPFVVAAAVQGDLPSFYDNNPLPEGVTEDQLVDKSAKGRVLVTGSGEFFNPNPRLGFNQQLAGLGGQFLINSIEWLVQDTKLTEIRGKSMPRLIGEVPKERQRSIQFVNIAGVPSLFALLGWIMMRLRRRRREKLKA